jgi:hypothetical protein
MARRYDVDWLRVLLFGLLVLHHSAVGFAPFGASIYGFANDELGGPLVSLLVYWSHTWRLPALFLIAGLGTWFATSRSYGINFLGHRLARLLVPLLVGSFLLNPLAKWAITWITGDANAFLSTPAEWWLPVAPYNVMHLWFLGNLALYTVLCWPLYRFREQLGGSQITVPWFLLGLVGTVTTITVLTKPYGQAIAGDGYQLYWYFGFFVGGYLIGARHTEILEWARRWVWWLMALGIFLFLTEASLIETTRPRSNALAEALAAGGWATGGLAPAYGLDGIRFAVVEGLDAWAWCLTALGLAARYLNQDGPWLRTLSPAVFPIYVFHFPVVIVGLALLTQTSWPWFVDFLLLAFATYALSTAGYLIARRLGPLVWVVGGKPAGRARQP